MPPLEWTLRLLLAKVRVTANIEKSQTAFGSFLQKTMLYKACYKVQGRFSQNDPNHNLPSLHEWPEN